MEYSSVTKKTDLESASKKKIKILLFSIFKMTVVQNFTKVFHSKYICQRLCLVDSYRIFAIYTKKLLSNRLGEEKYYNHPYLNV